VKLSKLNKIYVGLVLGVYLIFFVVFIEKTPFMVGKHVFAPVLALFIVPTLIAWVVWRLSGRRDRAGNIAFAAVLSLLLLGQAGQLLGNVQESRAIDELERDGEEFRRSVATNEHGPSERAALTEEYADKIQSTFEQQASQSSGAEKLLYKAMEEFVRETRAANARWKEAYEAAGDSRILDYSVLTNHGEFEAQRNTLKKYVAESVTYGKYHTNMMSNLAAKLDASGVRGDLARGTLEGARRKYELQRPILVPLMEAHVGYGQTMLEILDLLEESTGKWSLDSDTLQIEDDAMLSKFNALVEQLAGHEESVNTLSGKLLKVQ
jgi:hypothetical protein